MIDVLRIQNPAALQLPAIRNLLRTALSTNTLIEDVEEALDELDYWVVRSHAGLYIVRERGSWVGMGFAQRGESAFAPYVSVVHVYNRGSTAALAALQKALVDFAREGGYSKGLTLDMNGNPEAFQVLFGKAGRLEPIGTAYFVRLNGEGDGRQLKLQQTA